jgi:hypothetical protein
VATFHDANLAAAATDFTAVIDVGGGTTTVSGASGGIVSLGSGTFAILASGAAVDEGSHGASVEVFDIGGASVSISGTFTVTDLPLTLTSLTPPAVTAGSTFNGTVATFIDGNPSAPAGDFSAQVSWGDGVVNTVPVASLGGGAFAVVASHTYGQPGTLPFSVTVNDEGGSAVFANGTALIAANAVSVNLTGVGEHYTLNSQQETVTVGVTSAGKPVNGGSVTITDGGQSQTTAVTGGVASATFVFGFAQELPRAHPIQVTYNNTGGLFAPSSISTTVPASTQGYFFQIWVDALLLSYFLEGR